MQRPPSSVYVSGEYQADPRLPSLRAELAERLRGVCGEMDAAAFDQLVTDVCEMKLRWSDREVGATRVR